MMLGLHQMPLEQTTQSLVNVAAGSDISPILRPATSRSIRHSAIRICHEFFFLP